MLITFSGLDGAGKTTLIEWLRTELERQRRPVSVLHLNDDVGVYAWARAVRDRLFGGPPVPTVQPRMEPLPTRIGRLRDGILWSKTLRALLYPVDVISFLVLRLYVETLRGRILIMDRYFYDRLVDVAGPRGWAWLRLLARVTPTPDLPVLLDITPELAFARKGEYTVAYLRERDTAYRRVFPWVPASLKLPATNPEAARQVLARAVRERLRP
jgi:thymidylate kinase